MALNAHSTWGHRARGTACRKTTPRERPDVGRAGGSIDGCVADRDGGIASIATVIGARNTVRFSFLAYLLAAILVLLAGLPFLLLAALPYLVLVGQFWNITDETCESANRGWKRFIWLNFFAGAVVTFAWLIPVIFG